MNRREFSKNLLTTLTGVALLDTLFQQQLFARDTRPIAENWLKELHTMCRDLKTNTITPILWQQKINEFHNRLPLEDLTRLINFEQSIARFKYPDLGVVTRDPVLPKVKGISEKYSFTGRIFGMLKDRAVIPHGHKNMTSCHRVLKGAFLLRQYDRIRDEGDHMFIKQTIEETGTPGSFSSVSDDHNNIHWLVAKTNKAFTFDVIVMDLNQRPTEIDNIDINKAQKTTNNILKVKKLAVGEALRIYGRSHH